MVEPGTAIALLAPSALTLKMLGPTAEYIGDGVRAWAEARVANVKMVLHKADAKLEDRVLTDGGAVSPRVLKGILDEGSFFEDELSQDYLGGLLASSHSEGGRDDRAATYIDLLARLSTYQIRTHYLLYRAAQRLCAAHPDIDLTRVSGRDEIGKLFVRFPPCLAAMELSDDELDNVDAIVTHAFVGLHREGLIGTAWRLATDRDDLREMSVSDREFPGGGGVVFELSMFGMELFSAAHGIAGNAPQAFSRPSSVFDALMTTGVREVDASRVADLPQHVEGANPASGRAPAPAHAPRVTVRIPGPLRSCTDGDRSATAQGSTVGEVIADLCRRYPQLEPLLLAGGLGARSPDRVEHLVLFLEGEEVRHLEGLDTEVHDGDDLHFFHGFSAG